MQWFRLHNKLLNDPVVQGLDDKQFRLYINLLCHASVLNKAGYIGTLHETAFALRETIDDVSLCFTAFQAHGLIVSNGTDDETFQIPQWQKLQYKSDTSTTRVKKHREKVKRSKTVTVTAPDTDTDTEQTQSKTVAFESFWGTFKSDLGKKGSRKNALNQFKKISEDKYPLLTTALKNQISAKQAAKGAGEFYESFPHVERWLRNERYNDALTSSPQTQEYII